MPRPRVYVETTIPSAYHDERLTPEIVRRRRWTREWWATAQNRHELVTGAVVIGELMAGPVHRQFLWVDLIRDLPVLEAEPPVHTAYNACVLNKLMPSREGGDALHLALASFHRCEFLVTWNYKHLANPNKVRHIQRINERLGLFVPRIVTPLDLLGGSDEERGF